MPAEAKIHLYRIAQEAVSNAVRHGRAKKIVVSLENAAPNIVLKITDDGSGLSADARTKKGMGLRIMDYRAGMIGAAFTIHNLSPRGTQAVCVLNPNGIPPQNYVAEN